MSEFLCYRCQWWWHLVKKWPKQYSCASFLSPALETWCVWIEYVFNKHITRQISAKWNPPLCIKPAWIPAVQVGRNPCFHWRLEGLFPSVDLCPFINLESSGPSKIHKAWTMWCVTWQVRSWELWKLWLGAGRFFSSRLLLFICRSARELKVHCCFTEGSHFSVKWESNYSSVGNEPNHSPLLPQCLLQFRISLSMFFSYWLMFSFALKTYQVYLGTASVLSYSFLSSLFLRW